MAIALRIALPLLAVTSLVATTGNAAVLKVPSAQFPTIQSAVDAAVLGDIVEVARGTYAEAVLVNAKPSIVIRAKGKVVIEPVGAETGIAIYNSVGVVLRGFTVRGGTSERIAVRSCTGGQVTECVAEGATAGHGIRIDDCTGLRVDLNLVKDVLGIGIEVDAWSLGAPGLVSGADDSFVVKNVVKDTGLDGMRINGAGNLVEKNKITGVGGKGYVLLHNAENTTSRKNKVTRSGSDGIKVYGDNNALSKEKAIRGGDEGIEFEGQGNTMTGSLALQSEDMGILLETEAAANTLTNCRSVKARGDGICVRGDGNVLTECSAFKAGVEAEDHGFEVLASAIANTFVMCQAKRSFGFDLFDGAEDATTNTYTDCKFPTKNY